MNEAFSPDAIAAALRERWEEFLEEGETFEAALVEEDAGARATLALVDAEGATRHEFEVAAPRRVGGGGDARALALDAADALLGEWLEAGRPRLPGRTIAREYEGVVVEVTLRRVHPRLDAEADRILGGDRQEDDDGVGGLDA